MRARRIAGAAPLLVAGLLATPVLDAGAVQAPQGVVVSPSPAPWTPNVADGPVYAFTQVGNNVVAGGSFTSVTQTRASAALPPQPGVRLRRRHRRDHAIRAEPGR